MIDGNSLFVEVITKEKTTPLFLLPGGPGLDHLVYKLGLPEFEEYFTVVYYDPRGCGKSLDFDESSFTLEKNIADIEAMRSSLKMEKIMVLGHSYGRMVALGYAVQYPERVEKLILSAGAPCSDFIEKAKENLLARGSQEQIDICEKYLWPGEFSTYEQVDHFFNVMRGLYSRRVAENPELANQFNSLIKCNYLPVNAAFKHHFWNFNFVKDLHRITCKTQIISGKYDWINDPMFAEIMHRGIKHSTLTTFDTGHSFTFDCHDEYIKTCVDFLLNP